MQATVNGITLNYEDRGQGLPLLLIHGFPLSNAMWQQQIEALSASYRVIAPDLRGFGTSDITPGPYPMETFANDLVALLDTLAIEQAVLCGLSMGGYISFAFLRDYAERIRGLILCDTRARDDSDEGKATRETNAQLVEREGANAIADRMLPNLLSPNAPQERHDMLRAIIAGNSPQAIAAALRGMGMRPDSSDLLPTITVPTLLVVGEEDALSPPSEMRELQQHIPDCELAVIPAAGHVANLDNPQAFNEAVSGFLAKL